MQWHRHPLILRAAQMLSRGEVIAYPTEAVWGLGCAPDDEQAVLRLLALKRRDYHKGLILVAASEQQLSPYLQPLSKAQRERLSASWPGPNTWLIPDLHRRAPDCIRGGNARLAVRVSAHPVVVGLCRAFGGPIVSTSANPQGKPAARYSWQVRRYFGDQLAMLTPGRIGDQLRPTAIRDLESGGVIRPA